MKQNYLTKKQIRKIKKKARKYKKLFDKITEVLNNCIMGINYHFSKLLHIGQSLSWKHIWKPRHFSHISWTWLLLLSHLYYLFSYIYITLFKNKNWQKCEKRCWHMLTIYWYHIYIIFLRQTYWYHILYNMFEQIILN